MSGTRSIGSDVGLLADLHRKDLSCITSCHRCGSGKKLNEGMPCRELPLEIFQNNVPSLARWTLG